MHIRYATFLFDVDPETKYILRVFRVDESFWTQKQSCITQKVGLEKWCLFFDFVCFSGRHFTLPHFAKKDIGKNFFLKFLHFHLTFLHHISKIWGCVLQFWFILILAMCVECILCIQWLHCNQNYTRLLAVDRLYCCL